MESARIGFGLFIGAGILSALFITYKIISKCCGCTMQDAVKKIREYHNSNRQIEYEKITPKEVIEQISTSTKPLIMAIMPIMAISLEGFKETRDVGVQVDDPRIEALKIIQSRSQL